MINHRSHSGEAILSTVQVQKMNNLFNKSSFLLVVFILYYATKAGDCQCHRKFQWVKKHSACLPKSDKAKSVPLTQEHKDLLLKLHNERRSIVNPPATNMMKMRWDEELEMIALRWAETCNKGHDQLRFIPGRFQVGQNLWWGNQKGAKQNIPVLKAIQGAVNAWDREKKDYTYGEEIKRFDNSKPKVGHYTQLVWAQSLYLGCAMADCGIDRYLVCNYGPGGNGLPFSRPYETGEKCSRCQNCVDGALCECEPGVECRNLGKLKPSSCSCKCDDRVTTDKGPQCALDCSNKTSDKFFCGGKNAAFGKAKCHKWYMLPWCPRLCEICPYATDEWVDPATGKPDKKSTASYLTPSGLTNVALLQLLLHAIV